MPELAEVEHSRRQWNPGLGKKVKEVFIGRPDSRIYRGTDTEALKRLVRGRELCGSAASGKQLLFSFSGGAVLGIHLGMRGELRSEQGASSGLVRRKHDYLVLTMKDGTVLAFEDKRLFGRVLFHAGPDLPEWWTRLPPSVLSDEFTLGEMRDFLQRRSRTAVKSVLLMQERFPGVGNWMADEILWRAHLHPGTPSGGLAGDEMTRLYKSVRWVSRTAVKIVSDEWTYPDSWLFTHRWAAGGDCPRCGVSLARASIGGRTTSWCPHCQPPAVAVSTGHPPKTKKRRTAR